MEEELIRVINKSVFWMPAKQGDKLIWVRKIQAITFNVDKY
jgi:hypothetical protein